MLVECWLLTASSFKYALRIDIFKVYSQSTVLLREQVQRIEQGMGRGIVLMTMSVVLFLWVMSLQMCYHEIEE